MLNLIHIIMYITFPELPSTRGLVLRIFFVVQVQEHKAHVRKNCCSCAVHSSRGVYVYSVFNKTARRVYYFEMLNDYVRSQAEPISQKELFSKRKFTLSATRESRSF